MWSTSFHGQDSIYPYYGLVTRNKFWLHGFVINDQITTKLTMFSFAVNTTVFKLFLCYAAIQSRPGSI